MLFSYGSGQQQIDGKKNAGELMAILIVMEMQWYDAGHIARWITSRASLEATGCRQWSSACIVLSRRPPWLVKKCQIKHTKHQQNTTFSYHK